MNELKITRANEAILKRVNRGYAKEATKFLAHVQREGITADSVKDFVSMLGSAGYSAATFNKHLSAVKNVLKTVFLNSPEITAVQKFELDQFLSGIKGRKISKGERAITVDKILSEVELETMIEKSPKRSSLIIEFLYFTGCRISESLNIVYGDVKKEQCGYVYLRIFGKGSKERTVKIPGSLFNRINDTFQGTSYLFESKSGNKLDDRNVAKEFRRLGLKHINRPVTPHMLRHTRATQLIRKTGKIQAVSEFLGHSTAAITLDMYCHQILEDSDLEA